VSYLDVPRLHFSGEFFADPSTLNNFGALHDNSVPIPSPPPGWNSNGRHHFKLQKCIVGSAVDASGTVLSATAQDKLVQGPVTSTATTIEGRLVDLDPDYQTGSQIWGLEVNVRDTGGEGFSGKMDTASLRELWGTRGPGKFSLGFGGTYQSLVRDITWTPFVGPMESPLLGALRTASPNLLSIRLVTSRYDASPPSTGFLVGQLAGTIGPATATEPAHFIPDRRVLHAGTSGGPFGVAPMNKAAFNTGPFKIDTARKPPRLVIDLGNALPEDKTGARRSIGELRAEIAAGGAVPAERLGSGPIPNSTKSFRANAGVEEIPLSAAQVTALATRPLQLKAGSKLVLAEHPGGILAEVTETVVRLNPGETADVDLVLTQLGKPMAGTAVLVDVSQGPDRPTGVTGLAIKTGPPAFATTQTLPASVVTGADGHVTLRLVASDPGHPRAHIDGEVSFLGFYLGGPTPATQRGEIAVRVFDPHTVPAKPRWPDVQSILVRYFRLYPAMRQPTAGKPFGFIDLNDPAQIQAVAPVLALSLRRAETEPNYMPVTRDLSRDKKKLLLKWLDAGAPV
jgi:hypothetical protein